ncbi:hypothetical protein GGR57DRAFT_461805 [Xylariaceae sp. FL1272]|nr:hypothetical protein GGR57DRAFT_461805 [Xylariaceae sp. FL1272]
MSEDNSTDQAPVNALAKTPGDETHVQKANASTTGRKRRLDLSNLDPAELERIRKRTREFLETPTEEIEERLLSSTRAELLKHLEQENAMIFLEMTPHSSRGGASCQHMRCEDKIHQRDYRIAVSPGMNNWHGSPDLYHVKCFETLVDFSNTQVLSRFKMVTRNRESWSARGLGMASVLDGNHFLDGGAERLVLHWNESMDRLAAQRDGTPYTPPEPEVIDLLYKAGSASFTPTQHQSLSHDMYYTLIGSLVPIESDGPDDTKEWNLFDEYVKLKFDDIEDLNQTHSLSSMLQAWRSDRYLAAKDNEKAREKLGEKAIRAIKRLSSIHV